MIALVVVPAVAPTLARADAPLSAQAELSLHVGAGEKQEDGEDRSLFASVLVGGTYRPRPWLELAVDLAATKATADWEMVSGLGSAALSARVRGTRDGWRWHAGAGVTIPLATVGHIEDFPEGFDGDSLVYSATTPDEDTWDYSAYRRAAMNRGAWNAWMWAPDWVTVFVPARVERELAPGFVAAADGAAALAFAVGEGHDAGATAVVAQAALDGAWQPSPTTRLGLRLLDVLVVHDDLSPHLLSLEPYAAIQRGRVDLRFRLTIPVRDFRVANAMEGTSGFRAYEEWGFNTSLGVAL